MVFTVRCLPHRNHDNPSLSFWSFICILSHNVYSFAALMINEALARSSPVLFTISISICFSTSRCLPPFLFQSSLHPTRRCYFLSSLTQKEEKKKKLSSFRI
ncbi:hypothetical protein F5H01DRAFT_357246 [Linnemannia elongata]|nr:hypothetical protein F5H01DRAFT_357246 [Linnemannia elongata]